MKPHDATRAPARATRIRHATPVKRQVRGAAAERAAADYLTTQGLEPLGANWRRRFGEIDLVMREPSTGTIVFVEVRFRTRGDFGGALESVDRRKRARLRTAAFAWLQRHADPDDPARIDVVAVAPAIGATAACVEIDRGPLAERSAARHGDFLIDWIVSAVEDDGD